MPAQLGIKEFSILDPDALDRTRFDHLTDGLVDGGTVVFALLPAFEKKGQHLIRFCVVDAEHVLSGEHLTRLRAHTLQPNGLLGGAELRVICWAPSA
jgi:hypothetical protein